MTEDTKAIKEREYERALWAVSIAMETLSDLRDLAGSEDEDAWLDRAISRIRDARIDVTKAASDAAGHIDEAYVRREPRAEVVIRESDARRVADYQASTIRFRNEAIDHRNEQAASVLQARYMGSLRTLDFLGIEHGIYGDRATVCGVESRQLTRPE